MRGASGLLYPGVRIENASFPLTITASQAAIFSCLSEGDTPDELHLQYGKSDELADFFASHFNCSVHDADELPKGNFFDFKYKINNEIRSELEQLQANCLIEQSNFAVSCLLFGDESVVSGVNIEFDNWQIGLCAERVAVSKAISNGVKSFKSIHITAAKGDFISPCGACRQVLIEFLPYEQVNLYHPDGTVSSHIMASLLPGFFNGSSIQK